MQDHSENRAKGDKAEQLAVKYLQDNGYQIKKRNFHFGKIGELDIVAEKSGTLVFVEVRSRYDTKTIDPIHTLNPKKRKALRKSAEGFLYVNKLDNINCRMDFIKIDMFMNPPYIEHFENAF